VVEVVAVVAAPFPQQL